MSKVIVTKQRLTDIADVIRQKRDTTKAMTLRTMVDEISQIGKIPGEIASIFIQYWVYFENVEEKNINLKI